MNTIKCTHKLHSVPCKIKSFFYLYKLLVVTHNELYNIISIIVTEIIMFDFMLKVSNLRTIELILSSIFKKIPRSA